MPAAKMISGSVVPATRRARRTGNEGFGNTSPGVGANRSKHRRSRRISPRILEGYKPALGESAKVPGRSPWRPRNLTSRSLEIAVGDGGIHHGAQLAP